MESDQVYQVTIAILVALLFWAVWMLAVSTPTITVTEVRYEQTPFQWQCPEPVKCNCSVAISNMTIIPVELPEIKQETVYYDGDLIEPTPYPTDTQVRPGPPLETSEFPFLHGLVH